MVGIFAETFFAPRELFQSSLCVFRATFLQALAQGMMALARLLNRLSAERLALAISSKVDDTQINAEGIISSSRRWGRNIKGYCEIEGIMAIDQIGLPLNASHTGRLIASDQERDKHTARKRQEGHGRQALKAHDSFVKDDRPLWPERGLDALVALVDIGCFAASSF